MPSASAELHAAADVVATIPRAVMIAVARSGKEIVTAEGNRLVGADGMKGKKKRGLKLRARDTIRDTDDGATCRIQGSVPGWVWMNTGARPHTTRRRKRGPKRKLRVSHPGMRGRGAWDAVAVKVADDFDDVFAKHLAKAKL